MKQDPALFASLCLFGALLVLVFLMECSTM